MEDNPGLQLVESVVRLRYSELYSPLPYVVPRIGFASISVKSPLYYSPGLESTGSEGGFFVICYLRVCSETSPFSQGELSYFLHWHSYAGRNCLRNVFHFGGIQHAETPQKPLSREAARLKSICGALIGEAVRRRRQNWD